MINTKFKCKRNKAVIALLPPIICVIFLLGWVMYWAGGTAQEKQKPKKNSTITVGAIVQHELEAVA